MTPFRLLPFVLLALPAAALTPPTDLLYGHYELHVDYAVTPGNPDAGWRFSVSYDEDDDFSTGAGVVRLDPESTVILAAPRTATAVPSPAGAFARFGPPGTPLWVLPQNNAIGTPFLGVRTTMSTGLFQARVGNNYSPSSQGSISLRLVSVEGTGPDAGGKFATWKTESFGSVVFSFDTTDGIGAAEEIPTIPVSSHTHYNWAFTKPGLYRVTLEAKGKLMPGHGNVITSARKTFLFAVPFSSRIAGVGELRVVAEESGPPRMIAADPANGVAYTPDRAMLETVAATTAGSALPGARWQANLSLSTIAAALPNGVGIDPAVASSGLAASEWSDLAWNVTGVRGPGNFALIEGGSAAGFPLSLSAGSTRNLVAAFTETGIYRVTGTLSGSRAGVPFTTAPYTLTFGAGLGADFTYAAWQASFERAAGLPTGSLADPEADHDGDGLANGVEFAFFWHGLDPARSDAHLMPLPAPGDDSSAGIGFLRDTYKDPLDESSWEIRGSHSADLFTWRVRSSRIPGFPLGIFETGAEQGNTWSRIMHRRLRVLPAPQSRGFFRFDVSAP
ncbi:choice-of-anchor M domain-containing protein [Luteolibacter flavescens]|uniref:Choice-of-anchor M domain-containing protein n=1 Tax=Luteolibacter flavescens TaxID=1859460 RepID=A0ABT3FRI8_9BACT|nr:choice-of-anchor M domain-containing protein [Luteolibacter flavescens]MCW1885580.1 choice-of-anchor M domain-containing protein [Luteolibacter flavescens]